MSCAGTGQDGELRLGAPLSYTDNGDGTITDNNTGLTWEKQDRGGGIHDVANTYTWQEAFSVHVAGLNAASFAGHGDWRLPNAKELQSIVNFGSNVPAVSSVFNASCTSGCTFTGCSCNALGNGWSSTSVAGDALFAWGVSWGDGTVIGLAKASAYTVRAVRGSSSCLPATGQTTCWDSTGNVVPCAGTGHDGELRMGAPLSYTDNGDGTVTDGTTGLVWEKLDAAGGVHQFSNAGTWDTAFTHVASLNAASFAGMADWRVPNARELLSIINFEKTSPAASSPAFSNTCLVSCVSTVCSCTGLDPYWSSTTLSRVPLAAMAVRFLDGQASGSSKGFDPSPARAVRGAP